MSLSKSLVILKSIYVISTEDLSKRNEFKFGKHMGSKRKLLSRYETYHFNPIIYYFRSVDDYTLIENKIKSELEKYRIQKKNGKRTEWVKLDLPEIISHIDRIINDYEESIKNKLLSVKAKIRNIPYKKNILLSEEENNTSEIKKLMANIYKLENLSDIIIAELFYMCYPNKFFYDRDLNIWYFLNNYNIYQKEGMKVPKIKNLMISDFKQMHDNFYNKLDKTYSIKISEFTGSKKQMYINNLMLAHDNYNMIIKKLQNTYYQNKIIDQLCIFYRTNKKNDNQ